MPSPPAPLPEYRERGEIPSIQHNHAWIDIVLLRVQSRRRQQLLRDAVVEIHIALAGAVELFRHEREITAVSTQRRRLLVRRRIEAGQRQKLLINSIVKINIASASAARPI